MHSKDAGLRDVLYRSIPTDVVVTAPNQLAFLKELLHGTTALINERNTELIHEVSVRITKGSIVLE